MENDEAKSLKPVKSSMQKSERPDQLKTVKGYREILQDVQEILLKARSRAYQAIDKLKVEAYWEVGQRITKGELENKNRADYGKAVIMRLSLDTGIDKSTLYDAHHFFKEYPNFRTVCGKLTWSIWRRLIYIADAEEREFYRLKSNEENWTFRRFVDACKTKQFQKRSRKRSLEVASPPVLENPQEVFREVYDFDFLKLPTPFKEYDLENAMLEKTIRVLTELGSHFCLAGRQVRILIDGNWDRIDLVFYHSKLHAYILADLKRGAFRGEYIGQMNKYIEYYRHNEETQNDNPTIGLILCEDIGYEEAVYALGGLEKKIFIAQYRVKLPSEKQIAKKLRAIKALA